MKESFISTRWSDNWKKNLDSFLLTRPQSYSQKRLESFSAVLKDHFGLIHAHWITTSHRARTKASGGFTGSFLPLCQLFTFGFFALAADGASRYGVGVEVSLCDGEKNRTNKRSRTGGGQKEAELNVRHTRQGRAAAAAAAGTMRRAALPTKSTWTERK